MTTLMQENLTPQRYGEGFASNIFRVWFGLAKSIVLCQLLASKNFGLFSECNCFMHNWSFFLICLLLVMVLDTLQNFKLFLVGVIIICFTLGPPTSRR